ncbi:MAG TPA: hypothetical protein VHE35_26550 [Kofleriaceae bacterium]|nr:hypothetical protein [Kofleriaceae bacterium]
MNRAVAMLKAAAFRAVMASVDPAYKLPTEPGSLEQIFARRLATRSAQARANAVSRARQAMAATGPARERLLGDLATLDLRGGESVARRSLEAPMQLTPVERSALVAHLQVPQVPQVPQPSPGGSGGGGGGGGGGAPAGRLLQIRIRQVICEDETDGFLGSEAGGDEIDLGGISIDETGDTKEVPPWRVGSDFDDGERVKYDPPKIFCQFDLSEGRHWPKPYVATLVLCEIDNGGFPGFLKDLLGEVKSWLLTAVGAAIGTAFGPLGTAIGAALGWILDTFVGWLISIWEDDVFPAITIDTDISGPHHVFASGTRTSSEKRYWTQGNGGKYWIYLDWHIET